MIILPADTEGMTHMPGTLALPLTDAPRPTLRELVGEDPAIAKAVRRRALGTTVARRVGRAGLGVVAAGIIYFIVRLLAEAVGVQVIADLPVLPGFVAIASGFFITLSGLIFDLGCAVPGGHVWDADPTIAVAAAADIKAAYGITVRPVDLLLLHGPNPTRFGAVRDGLVIEVTVSYPTPDSPAEVTICG